MWKPAKYHDIEIPNYEVSSTGSVRSLHYGKVRRMVPSNCEGYPIYTLRYNGRYKKCYGHVLVLSTFGKPKPEPKSKYVCNWKDGNPWNYKISNLSWVEKSEYPNKGRAYRDNTNHSTLTEGDVIGIYESPLNQSELAEIYGVSKTCIGKIKRGESWKHVTQTGL